MILRRRGGGGLGCGRTQGSRTLWGSSETGPTGTGFQAFSGANAVLVDAEGPARRKALYLSEAPPGPPLGKNGHSGGR